MGNANWKGKRKLTIQIDKNGRLAWADTLGEWMHDLKKKKKVLSFKF